MIPGEIHVGEGSLELNAGRDKLELVIVNTGDRPIQVGSHLHFPDANPALDFDRDAAQGYRLDVPSGTSVRLEPGVSRAVPLVRLAGRSHVPGAQLPQSPTGPTPKRDPRSTRDVEPREEGETP